VGDGQLRTGRDILLHRANSSGGTESAREADVIPAFITAQGFMNFGEASSQRQRFKIRNKSPGLLANRRLTHHRMDGSLDVDANMGD
jgi:hypothetical protein